jgi:hypothetical protein
VTKLSFAGHPGVIHSELQAAVQGDPRPRGKAWGMTLTTLITVNAVLGAVVVYGLVLLHAHAIRQGI